MSEAELTRLLAEGENLHVEFKRDSPISDNELIEAIVCLANTGGGAVLLGVENDGAISGLHESRRGFSPRRLEAMVANKTIPGLRVLVEVHQRGVQQVATLEVEKARTVVQTSDGRSLHRFWAGQGEPECRPMRVGEIASHYAELSQGDPSARVVWGSQLGDLNPLEIERLRQTIERRAGADRAVLATSDEDLARALGLAVLSDGRLVPTVTGLLLVGRQSALAEHVPTHEVAFQVLRRDLSVEFNEFYREPLVATFQRIEQLVEAHNSEQEFAFGIQRIGIPRFPMEAVREAVANALVHRDYAVNNGVYIRIDPTEGGLVIQSPGGFVEGIGLDNLLVAGPRPRNRSLADAFKRLGYVERTGRGVERIFERVLGVGRPAPSYSGSDRRSVRVVIPDGEADLGFLRLILDMRERLQLGVDWRQLMVLRTASDEGEVSALEISTLLQRDIHHARGVLEELVEHGMLESKGPKRSRTYHLSAASFERLGRKNSYARRRGLDEMARVQLIRTHLEAYGRITRAEVSDICNVTPRQAEYLLRKLRDAGEITFSPGARRGKSVAYVPAKRD